MPFDPKEPWAKLIHAEDDSVAAALPLLDHALDVAAVGEALLTRSSWRAALEATLGHALTPQDVARLVALTALHDLGKTNAGFQARWSRSAPRIGHEGQVAPLWFDPGLRERTPLWQTLKDWGAHAYLPALMAHHGRPREEFGGPPPTGGQNRTWEKHRQHWRAADGYDPLAQASRLIAEIRARYPLAWQNGPKLPGETRFIALFAGLVTLADWIGSDTKRFPVAEPHGDARIDRRTAEARNAVQARGLLPLATPVGDFTAAFPFPPRGVQTEADAGDLGPVALIEAETGSGKTEAALWRWLELRRGGLVDGLYFALPTRSAAMQLRNRVQQMLDRLWGKGAPEAFLAVPGYLRAGDAEGRALPGFEVRWDDVSDDRRWAAEHANRFLAARVAVGTIDQALLGALRVKNAPFRAAMLARSLLVVDEVHASDAYMTRLLERLLANHVAAGGHALLLSATLGASTRARLLRQPEPARAAAEVQPYPALSGIGVTPRAIAAGGPRAKTVQFETAGILDDADAIAARAVDAARAGASVLVVRNSVAGAVAVARAVETLAPDLAFRVDGVATLHHGRFAPDDRRRLDDAVEDAFGKARTAAGRVLVGTQTLEQSLDIDADLLLTDLAPIDVLLQRIGRLHRHERGDRGAFAEAHAIVLCPADRDLTRLLGRVQDRHGLGPMQDGRGVYPDLLQIEATWRLLAANARASIPADNRRLVEGALHPEVRDRLTEALGTAWANHDASLMGIAHAERQMAADQSLDLATPFRDLTFPNDEAIGTRLGARDLLVDFEPALPGPFGHAVHRLAIPHWMARGITAQDCPEPLGAQEDGEAFALGERRFLYGRWGLSTL